jgi:16S rRNA (uracil1498-N3)-methyltransferase
VVAEPAPTPVVAQRLAVAAAGLVLDPEAATRLSTVPLPPAGEVVLVIGPEGGLTPGEQSAFEAAGACPVRLGGTVLRLSTAGVAAVSVLSTRLGRW